MRLGMNRYFIREKVLFVCMLVLIFLTLILILTGVLYVMKLKDIFPVYAEKFAEYSTENAINQVSEEIFRDNPELNNIKTEDISFLTSDIQKLNYIKSQANHKISEIIESDRIKIPIGSLFGINILSGIGPEIPIYAKPIVITTSEFKDEFISEGINQTKYRVYLDINVDITFISSGIEYNKQVNDYMLISETVIIGNVPNLYNTLAKNTEDNYGYKKEN